MPDSIDLSVTCQNDNQSEVNRTISVTTVGTCRIADPIAAAATHLLISRNTTNIYGFVHTSKEILQQIDVLEGREIPAELVRFIASAHYESPQARPPTDLYLVEVSSLKEIHFSDHLLQVNCVDRVFQERQELLQAFFRNKYAHERETRAKALHQLPRFHEADPVEQRFLLEGHMHVTTRDELAHDLQLIHARLPAQVAFVCHIDVADGHGSVIEARARLCAWMREICEEYAYTLFDPSPQVIAFGRARALADEGQDTNHYTTEFKPLIGRMMFEAAAGAFLAARPTLRLVPSVPRQEPAPPPGAPHPVTSPAPGAVAEPLRPAVADAARPAPPAQPPVVAPMADATARDVRAVVSEAKASISRGEIDDAEVLLRGAVIDHPGAAELFALLGSVAYHRGDETAALADLQRALLLDGKAVEPRMLLVKIAQRLNRHEEACTHALELVGSVPDDHKALTVAAKALVKARRFNDAASVWRRVAMLRPEASAPLAEVARCELKGRNPEEAIKAADAALGRDPSDATALTLKAEALQRLKRMDDLASHALLLVAADPAAAMALVPALTATAHHEHAAAVIAAVRRQGHGTAADPVMQAGLVRSLTQRARAAAERGEALASASAWRAILMIEPDNRRAASGLRKLISPIRNEVRDHIAAGRLAAAIETCRRGLAVDPDEVGLLQKMARLLERNHAWAAASATWETLAGLDGSGTPELMRAARAAARAGLLVEALRLYAALPAEARRQVASTIGSLTRKLVAAMRQDFANGQDDDATRKASIIRDMDPGNAPAARLLARVVSKYRKLSKLALAAQDAPALEAHSRRILDIDPNRVDALRNLSRLHTAAKRPREAIDLLERLTRLEPAEPRHWHKLASACKSARRYDIGVHAALRAVELEPGNAKGLERLSDMLNRQALAA